MTNESLILSEALTQAGDILGVSQADLCEIIGSNNTIVESEIDPNSKQGKLALLFIRCYRSLFNMLGDDSSVLQHWFNGFNHGTKGIPCEQVKSEEGLRSVLNYIDKALRQP